MASSRDEAEGEELKVLGANVAGDDVFAGSD